MTDSDLGRRELLSLSATGLLLSASAAARVPVPAEEREGIPAPFDEAPTLENPDPRDRRRAALQFPPEAIPDEGAIPEPFASHVVEQEVVVPEWGIESAVWQLKNSDGHPDRDRVVDTLLQSTYVREEFVTMDGDDAVDAVLDRLQEEHDDA